MAWTNPPDFTAAFVPAATLNTYLRDNLLAQGESLRHIWIDASQHRDDTSGSWDIVTDTTPPNDPYGFGLAADAEGEFIDLKEYLTPGTWRCNIHTAKRDDYGLLKVTVIDSDANDLPLIAAGGGTSGGEDPDEGVTKVVGEFNCYDGDAPTDAVFQLADPFDFVVEAAGLFTIRFEIMQKDINSDGNTVRLFAIYLQKMSDLDTSPVVWTAPRTWTDGEYVSAADLATHMKDALRMSGCFRQRTCLDMHEKIADSGALNFQPDTGSVLGHYLLWDTQNEWAEWDLVLPQGDVGIILCGHRGSDHGIATVRWDGVDRGTTDFYNGSGGDNHRGAEITFTNSVAKKARLRITNATKNGSSSSYRLEMQRIYIGSDPDAWADLLHLPARNLVSVAELNAAMIPAMEMRGEMPWVITIDPLVPSIDNNGWSTYLYNSDHLYMCALKTNDTHLPGYDGFWVEWDVPFAAGTYKCVVVAHQRNYAGQIDVLLDGTEVVANAEFYHASANTGQWRTTSGISVSETKTYRVRVRINSKNASSTGFEGLLNRLSFVRTA
jgi:hypothetical protein